MTLKAFFFDGEGAVVDDGFAPGAQAVRLGDTAQLDQGSHLALSLGQGVRRTPRRRKPALEA
jgi:hypothetical protein